MVYLEDSFEVSLRDCRCLRASKGVRESKEVVCAHAREFMSVNVRVCARACVTACDHVYVCARARVYVCVCLRTCVLHRACVCVETAPQGTCSSWASQIS